MFFLKVFIEGATDVRRFEENVLFFYLNFSRLVQAFIIAKVAAPLPDYALNSAGARFENLIEIPDYRD